MMSVQKSKDELSNSSSRLMEGITAVILVIIVGYVAAFAMGKIEGDITAFLLILTLISFAYWLYDRVCLKPKRIARALEIEAKIRAAEVEDNAQQEQMIRSATEGVLTPPWWVEWTGGFFWVIFIVFVVRSFIIEPYRIPSNSMMSTLEAGDFILVSKSGYGIKVPVLNKEVVSFKKPKRGDVVVFKAPNDGTIMIKRVIGLPGDEVVYQNKQLIINGAPVPVKQVEDFLNTEEFYTEGGKSRRVPPFSMPQFEEQIDDTTHRVVLMHTHDTIERGMGFVHNRPYRDACQYDGADFVCEVPQGHYFMMGDNRDNSLDSRYWGFVPEQNLIGEAFFIWFNLGKMSRIGSFE